MSNPEENVIVDAQVEETLAEEVTTLEDGVEVEASANPEPSEELLADDSEVSLSEEVLAPAEDLAVDDVITAEDLESNPELADVGIEVGTKGEVVKFLGQDVLSAKVVVLNGKNYIDVTIADGSSYKTPIDAASKELLAIAQNS